MKKRFGVLRLISTIFMILGWISLVVAAIGLLMLIISFITGESVITSLLQLNMLGLPYRSLGLVEDTIYLGMLGWGVVNALINFAAAQIIQVQLAIEENTRATVMMLQLNRQG